MRRSTEPTLGSVHLLLHEETAKKHHEQSQTNEGETEGRQKAHADEERLHGGGNVLSDGAAETGGMRGEVDDHPLAQAEGQPSQRKAGDRPGEKTQRSLAGLF